MADVRAIGAKMEISPMPCVIVRKSAWAKSLSPYSFCALILFAAVLPNVISARFDLTAIAVYFFAYSTWEGTATLYLEDLFVREEFRGARIGAAMMKELAAIAQRNHCVRFEWSVLDWNRAAIDFYERIGAQPVAGWTRYRLAGEDLTRLQSRALSSPLLPCG